MCLPDAYRGRLFSILGDSISTLADYSEPHDAAFYEGMRKFEADVFVPDDTWWGRVIDRLGGTLLVNHSISGSTVTDHSDYCIPSYGCSDARTAALHRGNELPDVVMIYMGINDWGRGVRVMPGGASDAGDLTVFSVAYRTMLEKLRHCYPGAEIWCMTIPASVCTARENFSFPYRYGGRHIEEYCAAIRSAAEACGCRVIDLYRSAERHDTIDGFHPNKQGMETIADAVLRELRLEGVK